MVLDKRQVGLILADETLGKIVSANLREISRSDLIEKPIDELSSQDFSDLRDEVIEVWSSHSKVVREYIARQDKGPYPICIRGLEGAYFVTAGEYPDSESHASLMDAEIYVEKNYGRFLLD